MLTELAAKLAERGARDEALGAWQPERRRFGRPRPAVLDPAGRVWRLGALLLDRSGQLYATGKVTRALVPKDFNSDKTLAGEARREVQRAAARGRFLPGETVNYEWQPVTAEQAAALVAPEPLADYLRDRAELLGG